MFVTVTNIFDLVTNSPRKYAILINMTPENCDLIAGITKSIKEKRQSLYKKCLSP